MLGKCFVKHSQVQGVCVCVLGGGVVLRTSDASTCLMMPPGTSTPWQAAITSQHIAHLRRPVAAPSLNF
jgi:hypothetical protein